MFGRRVPKRTFSVLAAWLTGSMVVQTMGIALAQFLVLFPMSLLAAPVVIDSTVSSSANANNFAGAQTVFIDDDTGYTFYRDSTSQCVYSKTSDGGVSWDSAVVVDSQTDCLKIVVWYDRWTPGNATGTNIHIATMDSSDDALFYNRLDTSDDSLLLGSSPVNATINSGQSPTFSDSINSHAITVATDGSIYLTSDDFSDAFVVSCASNCNNQSSWSETGTSPLDARNDHSLLVPLSGGDVLLINNDVSADDIRSTVWDGVTWSSWDTIDANAPESNTYDVGMSATVDQDTGDVYLVYASDHGDTIDNDDIRTARYSSGGWSNTTDVLTNPVDRGVHNVAIAVDENTDTIIVAYTVEDTFGDATSANLYYQESTDNMTSWGGEVGPLNTSAGNLYGLSLNFSNFQRIYATWFDPAGNDRFGETVQDIGPDTELTTIGTQLDTVQASSSAVYIGGAFVVTTASNRTVTDLTISETGSIDAANDLSNVAIYYDVDSSAPYDCAGESYDPGLDAQFGVTDTDGFSGANGTSEFAGTSVEISSTSALCLYPVFDVEPTAADGETIEIEVTAPDEDVTVTGTTVFPATAIALSGTTEVVSANLTQTHYHWRNDDGSESGATSATGAEDTPLSALAAADPRRLRVQVSNEGSTSTSPTLTLEYGTAAPTCGDVTTWTPVVDPGGDWDLSPTVNLTDGADTTNIGLAAGGVSDENTTFITNNDGVRDSTDGVGPVAIDTTEFIELEYSLVASSTASEGQTYCFRLTDNGTALTNYSEYPQATIDADLTLTATSSMAASVDIPSTNSYFGGVFALAANAGSHTITDVTLTEIGTVDASSGLENVRLYYEFDTSAPYTCASESYDGTESQFGATNTSGFSSANGTSTFSDSVVVTDTQTLCLYVVADVTSNANGSESVQFSVNNPTTDISAGVSSVSPGTPVTLRGSTTLAGSELTQTGYHWRNDDGGEATSTSATGGSENTMVQDIGSSEPLRLRVPVSNEGATTSLETRFTLQYAARTTTCDDISTWTDVDAAAGDSWDMYDSAFLTHAMDTTNIAVSSGGVSDPNDTFLTNNNGVLETSDTSATTTLTNTEFIELEYSIQSTETTAPATTYCFRVVGSDGPLATYEQYPQARTAAQRDYRIQRGNAVLTSTSTTLTAGVDYTAPSNANAAFIRITNSHHVGAGNTTGGGRQNADDVTTFIADPENIASAVTIARAGSVGDTHVDWEIIEFIGNPGTDNELVVRDVGTVSLSNSQLTATGSAVSVTDDDDVVVFITGVRNQNTSRNYYAGQFTADWDNDQDVPVLTRGSDGGSAVDVSYAVVEFTGLNWSVQRVEHAYTAAGTVETESITAVNSLSNTFLHTQKRMPAYINVDELGHTVWLSSIGAVSFELNSGANPSGQVSVAWVIENTQQGAGAMDVQRTNGFTSGGNEPLSLGISIAPPLDDLQNASIFMNTSGSGGDFEHPRALAGARILSTSTYQIWRSDTGSTLTYRTEIVDWPVADLAVRQNYYRFYEDNNQLTPADPWPPDGSALGENTSITEFDQPLQAGDVVRLRMSLQVTNANMPASFTQYRLQYAERTTTCAGATGWTDVGASASSTIWRGYAATGTSDGTNLSSDPPLSGDLLLSVSDVAGTLAHENPSAPNPFAVFDGEDLEFDWYIEQNGASPETVYCFRMVEDDGTLLDGYFNYPQAITAGFTPTLSTWRWFSDPENETPTAPLAGEQTAPSGVDNDDELALRIALEEIAAVAGYDVKFKLQYSEDSSFAEATDVRPTSTCAENSLWCYTTGGASDNTIISSTTLSGVDSCIAGSGPGCGTHNSSADSATGHTHGSSTVQEYGFTVTQAGARVNAVYYFRLVEVGSGDVVLTGQSVSNPSLQTNPSSLSFNIIGLPAGTTTAGLTTDSTTTPSAIDFGSLPFNDDQVAAQRLEVGANATEGYQILKFARSQLQNSYGNSIPAIAGSNQAPTSWSTGCNASSTGCVGYHTTDAVLAGGSTRFAANDTFAALSTDASEVLFSSVPTTSQADVLYRVEVNELQPAGDYETEIVYIAIPVY